MKKILPIIAVVVLLMLFMAPAASAAPPAWGGGDCGGSYHCVQWGETLYSIGRMYDKDPYYIAQANGLYNPNHIYAGQVLYIPPDGPSYPWYGHYPMGCKDDGCGDYGRPRPTPYGYGNDCNDYGCGDYGRPRPTPYYNQGYGYDYSGYYYEGYYPKYKRYSYTCGYYNNCY